MTVCLSAIVDPDIPHTKRDEIFFGDYTDWKYVVSSDGFTSTGNVMHTLPSALMFKHQSPYQDWFESSLVPGVHFEQTKFDFSDLIARYLHIRAQGEAYAERRYYCGRAFAEQIFTSMQERCWMRKMLKGFAFWQSWDVEINQGFEPVVLTQQLMEGLVKFHPERIRPFMHAHLRKIFLGDAFTGKF